MTDKVTNIVNSFQSGFVFTTNDFGVESSKQPTVNRILNNMVAAGKICRLSKGRFYKPRITQFGELQPDTYQIVKDLIEKNGKTIGYITGYTAFNQLLLTTQVPVTLQIGRAKEKNPIKRGIYKISFIKQLNAITKTNTPLLRLLDCLRFFKEIPDAMPNNTCRRLLHLFGELTPEQKAATKRLALNYNPGTIALLGAILETLNSDEDTNALFKALNPLTTYKLNIATEILPNQSKWYIK
ncbi:MAG: DUF6088 family protein [Paludibacter sp.]|nr:DUF6088 family protein [Paludibacter sp.]